MARETDSLALVCCKNAGFVGAFRESDSYSGLLAKLRARLKCEFVDFGEREWVAFRNELDRPHVEKWLLRRLIKDSEAGPPQIYLLKLQSRSCNVVPAFRHHAKELVTFPNSANEDIAIR